MNLPAQRFRCMSVSPQARANLTAKLQEAFANQTLVLYTANGIVNAQFVEAVPNLVNILLAFYDANGRFPKTIFNDGLPASVAAALKASPNFGSVIDWHSYSYQQGSETSETGQVQTVSMGLPKLSVRVGLNPGAERTVVAGVSPDGETYYRNELLGSVSNGTYQVPSSYINAGAFNTWGILLVIYSRPDFVYATDEGILLTPNGVTMLENSLPYWLGRLNPPLTGWMCDVVQGPFTVGMPYELLMKVNDYLETAKKKSGANAFFLDIVGMALSFAGFAAGVTGLSNLVAGAINAANIGGALSVANKLGVNTGSAGTFVKIFDLTSGTGLDDTLLNSSSKVASMSTFGDDIGIPGFGDYSDYAGDITSGFDWTGGFDMTANDAWAASLSLDQLASLDDFYMDIGLPDYAAAAAAFDESVFNQQIGYNAATITAENNEAMAKAMGPVSATQLGQMAKAAPAVTAAASSALKKVGANPNSASTSAEQVAKAQALARQRALTSGDASSADLWGLAAKALGVYGQYQVAAGKTLPNSTAFPGSGVGSIVRQPDGSYTVRNADGTLTTVRPNGASQITSGNTLPSWVSANKTILIAGGAAVVIGVIAIASNRR